MTTQLQIGLKVTYGFTTVDDIDADIPGDKTVQILRHKGKPTYAIIQKYSGNKNQQLHRIIAERMIGRPLVAGEVVDHINGDILDNRRCNLRVTTARVNQQNKAMNRKGHLPGTHFKKKLQKWVAHAFLNGIYTYLGAFPTQQQAHQAYLAAI